MQLPDPYPSNPADGDPNTGEADGGALVPAPAGRSGASSARGSAMRMEEPVAGTYWRLRADLAEHHDQRIQTGDMEAGTVLMLARVEHADGAAHAYEFAAHPLWGDDAAGPRFHADVFYVHWEPEPDGERVRAEEMRQLMADMDATQKLLMQPPPDAPPVALLGHSPIDAIGEAGRALATPDQVQAIARHAEQLRADAQARSSWISKHTGTLGTQGAALAAFHQERAAWMLARAEAQLEGVKGLLATVANLQLYTGKDVDLLPLRDGAPAAPGERLHIYQDVLALDEELLIHVDSGGADHTKTEAIRDALADMAVVARLVPAERGIVLVNFSNRYKEFVCKEIAGAALVNNRMNRESMRRRLLVRDGQRLWLVDAPDVLDAITQLMPSAAEQGAYYRRDHWGAPPEEITRDDLDYAQAQRRQMHALDHYGKVLIALWGLTDRGELFAGSHLPRFSNWLDEGFQRTWLSLVSHDHLLGVERPGFAAWQREQNQLLVAGSWVAIHPAKAFNTYTAPGAYSNPQYSKPERIYSPRRAGVHIGQVQANDVGLFVDVPCQYDGYRDGVADRNIKLYLKRHVRRHDDAEGVLVLDRAHEADLTYYLESRKQRRNYAEYVTLFRAARDWVHERDAHEAPLRTALLQAARDAQLPGEPHRIEAEVTRAIAGARIRRRGNVVPALGTAAYAATLKDALSLLHAQVVDHAAQVALLDAWAVRAGRQLLRLVMTADGQWRVYLVPVDAEHDARLGAPAHATIATVRFEHDAAHVDVTGRELLRPRPTEHVVHDWNALATPAPRKGARAPTPTATGAAHWLQRQPPFEILYAQAVDRMNLPAGESAHFDHVQDLEKLVVDTGRYMVSGGKYVQYRALTVVVGTLLIHERWTEGEMPALLALQVDPLVYAFHTGDDAIKDACRNVVRRTFQSQHIAARLQKLEASTLDWTPAMLSINEKRDRRGAYLLDEPFGPAIGDDDLSSTKGGVPRAVVTGLNPVGARLCPRLIGFAQAAVG